LAVEKRQPERRQYSRFLVGGRAKGRVTAVYEASLLDLSLGGALIEHVHIVRPGTTSHLILRVEGRDVNLRCRIIRSSVHRVQVESDGERALVYQTGLEFVDRSDATMQMIGNYIMSTMEAIDPPLTAP
jgi:c-di-GMP-binding flagellar brake protein YcgR